MRIDRVHLLQQCAGVGSERLHGGPQAAAGGQRAGQATGAGAEALELQCFVQARECRLVGGVVDATEQQPAARPVARLQVDLQAPSGVRADQVEDLVMTERRRGHGGFRGGPSPLSSAPGTGRTRAGCNSGGLGG